MNLKDTLKNNKAAGFFTNFIESNSPTLALIGGLGLMGVAIYKAFQASEEISDAKREFTLEAKKLALEGQEEAQKSPEMKELKTHRNIRYILAYRWVALFGGGAAAMFILCNYLNGAKIAGLTALAAWKQDEIKKFAENGKKLIGEEKFKELENMTIKDVVSEKMMTHEIPPFSMVPGAGKLCFDMESQCFFQAFEEDLVKRLEAAAEECSRNHGMAKASLMEKYLGLQARPEDVGYWGPLCPLKPYLGKRNLDMYGVKDVTTIEYHNASVVNGEDAGIPKFNK